MKVEEKVRLAQIAAEAGARAVLRRPLTDREFLIVQVSVRGALADYWFFGKYGEFPREKNTETEGNI